MNKQEVTDLMSASKNGHASYFDLGQVIIGIFNKVEGGIINEDFKEVNDALAIEYEIIIGEIDRDSSWIGELFSDTIVDVKFLKASKKSRCFTLKFKDDHPEYHALIENARKKEALEDEIYEIQSQALRILVEEFEEAYFCDEDGEDYVVIHLADCDLYVNVLHDFEVNLDTSTKVENYEGVDDEWDGMQSVTIDITKHLKLLAPFLARINELSAKVNEKIEFLKLGYGK